MRHLATLTLFCATLLCSAQDSDDRLPFAVSVTANGAEADRFTVTLYKDNEQVVELPPSEHGAFELALEFNAQFSIRISKAGYRDKVLAVNTEVPPGSGSEELIVYTVDLEPMDRFAHADPFYLDFPSALVQWDEATGEFTHSERYLANIQLKMALLSAQAEAE
ncbi:MAG TPA: hypothetical protein PK760_10660 [Flavobacteriales bacterium]|nr:hypothetical protein [Flavobacteriales bacterium]